MDEKQLAREIKQNKKEKDLHIKELRSRDRATHSESKTWRYNHKTGQLEQNKGR